MKFEFKSSGKIVYDPPRPGLKSRNEWWCVIQADEGIASLYRKLANLHFNPFRMDDDPIIKSPWGAHISVIRGEKPPAKLQNLWKKYHGKVVDFNYSIDIGITDQPTAFSEDTFLYLRVDCDMVYQIRNEFGFKTSHRPHLTIGKVITNVRGQVR